MYEVYCVFTDKTVCVTDKENFAKKIAGALNKEYGNRLNTYDYRLNDDLYINGIQNRRGMLEYLEEIVSKDLGIEEGQYGN